MKKLCYFLILLGNLLLPAQNAIKGVVLDKSTNETLIGANILLFKDGSNVTSAGAQQI